MQENLKNNILLVEDDSATIEIYRRKLQRENFQVSVARDGLEAMKQLPTLKPDLVLLDLMMPKFNGADVLKFIRSHKDLKQTKVVIFTNAYMTDLAQAASKAGADRSLLKSNCTPAQLLAVIRELLSAPADGAPASQGTNPVTETEKMVESQAQASFLESAPDNIAAIRQLFQAFATAPEGQFQLMRLEEFHRKVRYLAGVASVAGCHQISQLASGLEVLLFELQERPKNITPSVMQTIRATVDFLAVLLEHSQKDRVQLPPVASTLLVVDDDAVCNRALVHALGRARLKSTSADDSAAALKLLQNNLYDLILLDYFMPGMDGIELCTKLRELPGYAKTPVIFVTSATDFRQRAKNILQQGDDVITKPIFPIELAVKALTLLMKRQLEAHSPKATTS